MGCLGQFNVLNQDDEDTMEDLELERNPTGVRIVEIQLADRNLVGSALNLGEDDIMIDAPVSKVRLLAWREVYHRNKSL